MNELKPFDADEPLESADAVDAPETEEPSRDLAELPVTNWDDYKSWCEKVKENWDVS